MHSRARAALPLALLAVLALLGTAMTGGAATAPPTVNVADASGNNVMDPSSTTIKTGDTAKFHWNEGGPNVHFQNSPEGDVDLGYHSTGYETTHTFSKAGTYSFVCDSHSKMKGTITVQGAGSGSGAQPPPPPPPSNAVNLANANKDNVMDPSSLSIKGGDAIKFHGNEGGHNVHFQNSPEGDVDLGYHSTGYETSHTFSKAGTYSFVCDSHSKMKGTITVQGAGSGSGAQPPPPPPPSNAVNVANANKDNVMDPSSLSIKTGDAIKFHWNESGHNVHFQNSPEGDVDLGYHSTGYEVSHTFTQPGTYKFVCDSHSGMKGTIDVTGAPVSPAQPATSPQQPATDPQQPAADP